MSDITESLKWFSCRCACDRCGFARQTNGEDAGRNCRCQIHGTRGCDHPDGPWQRAPLEIHPTWLAAAR